MIKFYEKASPGKAQKLETELTAADDDDIENNVEEEED